MCLNQILVLFLGATSALVDRVFISPRDSIQVFIISRELKSKGIPIAEIWVSSGKFFSFSCQKEERISASVIRPAAAVTKHKKISKYKNFYIRYPFPIFIYSPERIKDIYPRFVTSSIYYFFFLLWGKKRKITFPVIH